MWWSYGKPVSGNYLRWAREKAWNKRQMQGGGACVQTIEIDPNGWIVYDLWENVNDTVSWVWHADYRLMVIENGSIVQDYRLERDEFYALPSMPQNWAIPF